MKIIKNMNIQNQFKKAAKIIPKTNAILQEFLALVAGIKPVMIHELKPNQVRSIKDNFPEIDIACQNKNILNKKVQICVMSKKKKSVKKIVNSLYKTEYQPTLTGELLGYPKCCVNNFCKYTNQNSPYDFVFITYKAYKASKKCNHFVNNLLNFSTRIYHDNVNIFQRYRSLNEKLPIHYWYYQYISHIPCRYDCPESIKIGKQISVLLKKYAPEVEKVVKYTLSKPILFFDVFKLIIFDGYLKEGILYYKKVIPPYFPVESPLMKVINKGNQVKVDDNKVEILKNNSILFTYHKKREADGFILDFSGK